MPDLKPQLKPKFWIIRAPDGTRSMRAAKLEHVTVGDIKKNLLHGWIVETVIEPELTPEMMELYKSVAALDAALGARISVHLRDLLGELVLRAYEHGIGRNHAG